MVTMSVKRGIGNTQLSLKTKNTSYWLCIYQNIKLYTFSHPHILSAQQRMLAAPELSAKHKDDEQDNLTGLNQISSFSTKEANFLLPDSNVTSLLGYRHTNQCS